MPADVGWGSKTDLVTVGFWRKAIIEAASIGSVLRNSGYLFSFRPRGIARFWVCHYAVEQGTGLD
jgi:hypothetical protein